VTYLYKVAAIVCCIVMLGALGYLVWSAMTLKPVAFAERSFKRKRRDAPPIVVAPVLTTYRPRTWPSPEPREPARFVPITARSPVPDLPSPIWHDALSPDATEHTLLAALRVAPNDAGARMVYADWLEEHGATAKASFVRGTDDLELRIAASSSDGAWRAITSCQNVRCKYPGCPARWSSYLPTDDERLRRCPHCDSMVRYCLDRHAANRATLRREVVVLDLANHMPPVPQVTKPYAFDLSSVLEMAFQPTTRDR
jgi:uncharacterized protein (TIGR02996 family)